MIAGTVINQPNEWLSLEVYQNKDAYQKHLETKHFKRYLEATKFCVESKSLHLLKSDFVSDQFFTVLKMILGKSVYVL